MAAIALDKTWVVHYFYYPNIATNTTAVRTAVIDIKNTMKAHGWTVAFSSDGTALGTGADDYWIDYADIVYATGAHSWIVLRNDNICTGYSVCLDFNVASAFQMNAWCCTAGYNADGTSTAKPTAAGTEVRLMNHTTGTGYWNQWGSAGVFNAIMYSSTDGQCTRIYWGDGNSNIARFGIWMFDVPKNPPTWFTTPYIAQISYSTPLLYNYFCETDPSYGLVKTNYGATVVNIKFGSIGVTGALGNIIGHRGQDYSGSFIFSPAYLCSITNSCPGIYGEMFDLYWTTGSFCYREDSGASGCVKTPGCLPSAAGESGFQLIYHMAQGNDGVGRGLI